MQYSERPLDGGGTAVVVEDSLSLLDSNGHAILTFEFYDIVAVGIDGQSFYIVSTSRPIWQPDVFQQPLPATMLPSGSSETPLLGSVYIVSKTPIDLVGISGVYGDMSNYKMASGIPSDTEWKTVDEFAFGPPVIIWAAAIVLAMLLCAVAVWSGHRLLFKQRRVATTTGQ